MNARHTREGLTAIPGFFLLLLVVAGATATCARPPAAIPLAPAYDSKDDAASAFLTALWARDRDTLVTLVVSETEFLKHIWPALPASRPDVGMPAGRAWAEQAQKNAHYLAQTLDEHGGRRYELVAVSFGAPATTYGAFTIHPDTTLDIRDESGVRDVRLFGSMIESGGRWKVYSYVVD
jgi:hypothetical protein